MISIIFLVLNYREQYTWSFTPTVGLVVAGGNNDGGRGANLDSVYRTMDGVTFDTLPSLYERIEAGCLVIIDDDEMLHMGGNSQVMKCSDRLPTNVKIYS